MAFAPVPPVNGADVHAGMAPGLGRQVRSHERHPRRPCVLERGRAPPAVSSRGTRDRVVAPRSRYWSLLGRRLRACGRPIGIGLSCWGLLSGARPRLLGGPPGRWLAARRRRRLRICRIRRLLPRRRGLGPGLLCNRSLPAATGRSQQDGDDQQRQCHCSLHGKTSETTSAHVDLPMDSRSRESG